MPIAFFRCLVVAVTILSGVTMLPVQAQAADDMLGVPGPISFQDKQFALSWSARPSADYTKQEYLPSGEQAEHYNEMFIVEANTSATPEAAATAQVDMLKQRKGTDPVTNYDVIRNDATGEIILDFLISDSSSGTVIVEWNAYRYSKLSKAGGVALYAISRRGYGDQARDFLLGLKQERTPAINALASFNAPALKPVP